MPCLCILRTAGVSLISLVYGSLLDVFLCKGGGGGGGAKGGFVCASFVWVFVLLFLCMFLFF